VQLLFERGRFLPADTAATAAAVRLYAVGLAGYSAVRITSPACGFRRWHKTPAIVSGVVILVNIAASLVLVRAIGFAGLALGTSIAAVTNAALLLWLLRARLGGLEDRRLIATLARVTVAAAVMAAAAFALQEVMERAAPGSALILRVTRLTISIGGALAVLAIAAKVLRIEEFAEAAEMVTARVRKLLDH
jgi:putative peptidoglycan lipid II flippase